jgi:hypothetical protein
VNNLATILRDLGSSLDSAQYGGTVYVPPNAQPVLGFLGRACSALAEFAEDLNQTASLASDIQHQLREEARVREGCSTTGSGSSTGPSPTWLPRTRRWRSFAGPLRTEPLGRCRKSCGNWTCACRGSTSR